MPYVGKVQVIEKRGAGNQIQISREAGQDAKAAPGKGLTVNVGSWKSRLSISYHNQQKHKVYVPSEVFNRMGKYRQTLHMRLSQNELEFGPWIAFYAFENRNKPPFGSLNPLLRDSLQIAERLGLPAYVLTPGQLTSDAGKSTLQGWVYSSGEWKRMNYPWPTFLISKIIVTPRAKKQVVEEEFQRLESRGCQFLSRPLGSKWAMYQAMWKLPELRQNLPRTETFRDPSRVADFLSSYKGAYIKPAYGTQGINVYRVRQRSDGSWELSCGNGGKEKQYLIPHDKQGPWVRRQLHRPGGYLLQQEIDLLRDENKRPTDFRWLLQKNGTGVWQVTARIARTGAAGAITTNLSTGGQVCQAAEYLSNWLNKTKLQNLIQNIDKVAMLCARAMEDSFGSMGELGVDIGVDNDFQIWILEANPRPGRKMLKIVSKAERFLSLQRPLEYARYATGFPL